MKKTFSAFIPFFLLSSIVHSQIDSSLLRRVQPDTNTQTGLNMDAVYARPFLQIGKAPVALGGYMEANWKHLGTDGISEGHQLQFRRMTLFVTSAISRRIKFLAELEIEDGGKEIALEFAAMDLEFHPLLNLRGGVVMNPIGGFNQNHDGPKWEFTDRPIAATQLLPATWSNAGFGLYGKEYSKNWMFGYEFYLTGTFDNTIINNEENKTFLPASKDNPERFEELNSGRPLWNAKVAIRNRKFGEIGLSYMGGVYNKFMDDGLMLDEKLRLDILAIDVNTTVPVLETNVIGEWVWISVDVPDSYTQQYGNKQIGGFIDIVQPVWSGTVFEWRQAVFNLGVRLEYVDWNVGVFRETGGDIADDLWSVMPAISFRPTAQTVLRLNYRYQKQRDLLGNPPANTGGFIAGISTYF